MKVQGGVNPSRRRWYHDTAIYSAYATGRDQRSHDAGTDMPCEQRETREMTILLEIYTVLDHDPISLMLCCGGQMPLVRAPKVKYIQ